MESDSQRPTLSTLEQAAIKWALQRRKFKKAEHLGKAACRAALQRRADELQRIALEWAKAEGK